MPATAALPWPSGPMAQIMGNWTCTFGNQSRMVRITTQQFYSNAPQIVEQDAVAGGKPFREVLYTNPMSRGAYSTTWIYFTSDTLNVLTAHVNEGYAYNVTASPVTFSVSGIPEMTGFQQIITLNPQGGFTRVWQMRRTANGPWRVVRTDTCH